jgi:glycosyltransferase involved in cell wall biosynthesis
MSAGHRDLADVRSAGPGRQAPDRKNQERIEPSPKKRRGVLIIVENLPVPFDRRVWQEARALHEAGYEVSVICPKGKGYAAAEEEREGIHIFRHPLPPEAKGAAGYLIEYTAALFWEFILSLKVLRRHGFDVIHACNPPDLIFVVAAFHKLLLGKKFLFDQHDLSPELYEVKFGRKGPVHRVLLALERCTYRLADATIATNETFKQIAIARGGVSPDRITVVKSYPDLDRFQPVPPNLAARSSFKFLLGYVGIMGRQDGVDILVRAMAHVVLGLGRTDIGCLIIGDGPERSALTALVRELGLERYITFTGFLAGEELLGSLCAVDVGIIPDPPNVCNDKISMNKVFEYMALGIPFVQFDLAQSRREAGDAAVVVPEATPERLAQSVVELIGDEPARRRMSASGKERAAREFRWANEKMSLVTAYDSLLSPNPARLPRRAVEA